MVYTLAARTDISNKRRAEYESILSKMDLEQLVIEFFTYLDYTEVKGMDDHEVKPIHIGCARALMLEPLGMVLQRLRERIVDN